MAVVRQVAGLVLAGLAAGSAPAAGPASAPAASPPLTPASASASAAPVGAGARISVERAAVNARYAEQERECRTRFVVASCVEDAKRERRLQLDRLRARQVVVDEARRHERAAARRSELAVKAAEDARRDAERAARAASAPASGASPPARGRLVPIGRARAPVVPASGPATSAASGSSARPRAAGKTLGLGGAAPKSPSERAHAEARNRAEFGEKQRRAAERRDEAATQAIRRMSTKTPASSLPAPSAASASRR
ncbi:MAG: hypothetical protein ABIQ06_09310 [Caldimonas sp.]